MDLVSYVSFEASTKDVACGYGGPRLYMGSLWACLILEIGDRMGGSNLPFTSQENGVLLDLDAAVFIITLSLMRDT